MTRAKIGILGKSVSPRFIYAGKKALEDAIGEEVTVKKVVFENDQLQLELEVKRPMTEEEWNANAHSHRCSCLLNQPK